MKTALVELLTDTGNNAVVRLSEREFPGVLIQGDTLYTLLELASTAQGVQAREEQLDALSELVRILGDIRRRYETAMHENNLKLPY